MLYDASDKFQDRIEYILLDNLLENNDFWVTNRLG